jgi:2'-5' RNA ligase
MAPAPSPSTGAAATEPPAGDGRAATARLFFAFWPDDATRCALLAHQARWRWTWSSRRTRAERLHATLLFLGDALPRDRIEALAALCPRFDAPVELVLDAPQLWAHGTAVLAASSVPAVLADAHDRLRAACGVNDKPWRPHVTLARRADGATPPTDEPIVWRIGRAVLVESDMRAPAHYRVIG